LTVAENKLSKYLFVYSRRQINVNIQQPYLKAEMRAEALGFRPFERFAVCVTLRDGRGLTVAENKLSKYLFVYSRRQTNVNIQQPYLKAEMRAEALGFRSFEMKAVCVTLRDGRELTIARNNQ
jgi:uncharacterized protein (DUF1499 family)